MRMKLTSSNQVTRLRCERGCGLGTCEGSEILSLLLPALALAQRINIRRLNEVSIIILSTSNYTKYLLANRCTV